MRPILLSCAVLLSLAAAPMVLAQAMAASLPVDHEGLILNLLDQRVLKLNPQFFSYTLSKAALETANQLMARAFAPATNSSAPRPLRGVTVFGTAH